MVVHEKIALHLTLIELEDIEYYLDIAYEESSYTDTTAERLRDKLRQKVEWVISTDKSNAKS
jgi:hypothetical protein